MRGRKNPNTPPPNNHLPACRVCGEPGTGFHYGVNTCGACKGFFRRSLTRIDPYLCYKNSLCHVGLKNRRRTICPKCRYEKCLDVGMSREACKVGRYSHAKKYKDYKEFTNDRESTSSIKSDTCQSEVDLVTSSTSKMEDSSQSGCSDVDPIDPILVEDSDMSFSNDEDNDSNSQEEEDSYTMRRANAASRTIYGENSYPMTHSLASSIGDGMRCVSGDVIDTRGIASSTATLNTVHNHGTQLCERNTVPSIEEHTISNERSSSMPLSSTNYCNHHVVTSVYTPFSNSYMAATKASEVENKNATDNDSISSMNITTTQPLCQGSHQTFTFSDDTNPRVHTSPQSNLPWKFDTQNPTNNYSSSPNQPTTSQQVSENLPQTLDHTYHCNNTTTHNTMQANNTPYVPNAASKSSHSSSLLTPNDIDYIFSKKDIVNDMTETDRDQETVRFEIKSSTKPSKVSQYNQGHGSTHCDNHVHSSGDGPSEEIGERNKTSCKHQMEFGNPKPGNSGNISMEMSQTLVPFTENKGDNDSPSFKLFAEPDPMKNVISAFYQFPYKAFEKQSLAPLLRLCYMENDWLDKYYIPNKQQTQDMASQSPFQTHSAMYHSLQHSAFSQKEEYDEDIYMDNFSEYIQKCHEVVFGQESAFLSREEATRNIEVFQKICQMNDALKGTLDFIDDDQYFNILEMTGFDADKRKEYFDFISYQGFSDIITRDAQFYRLLPGFKALSLSDRINLTKSSYMIVKCIFFYGSLDTTDCHVFIEHYRRRAVRISTYTRVLNIPSDFVDRWTLYAKAIRSMDITFKERILLAAYVVINPDFCDKLEDPKLVAKWNSIYLKCLVHHIRKTNGPNAEDRLDKLSRVFASFKSMCQDLKAARSSMKHPLKYLIDGEKDDLFRDVFT